MLSQTKGGVQKIIPLKILKTSPNIKENLYIIKTTGKKSLQRLSALIKIHPQYVHKEQQIILDY